MDMKGWHLGGILLLFAAYLVGVKWGGPGRTVLGYIGQ